MAESWEVDGPRVIDIGGAGERVAKVVVALIGGQVDVVTHEDSDGARVEISRVDGLPVRVSWDGRTLKVMHGKPADTGVLEALRQFVDQSSAQRADVSISVPATAKATISTVSAPIVASGLRRGVTANSVSGDLTVNDIQGPSTLNTVSSSTECAELVGDLRVNTVSGAVTVQSSWIEHARLNTVSAEVALDLRNGRLDVQANAVSGDVTIRAPFTGYAVTAASATGQVVVDGQSLRGGRRGGMPSADPTGQTGTLRSGDESLTLKANSVSGSVVLLRAGGASDPRAAAGPDPQDAAAATPAGAATPTPQDAPRSAPVSAPQDAPVPPPPSSAAPTPLDPSAPPGPPAPPAPSDVWRAAGADSVDDEWGPR